jgi:hypothetical protein
MTQLISASDATSGTIDAFIWVLVNGLVIAAIWGIVKGVRGSALIESVDGVETESIELPVKKMGVYWPSPGWQTDPLGSAEKRFWDGERWTNRIKINKKLDRKSTPETLTNVNRHSDKNLRDGGAGSNSVEDIESQIRLISKLHSDGLLTTSEFEAKKREILGRI